MTKTDLKITIVEILKLKDIIDLSICLQNIISLSNRSLLISKFELWVEYYQSTQLNLVCIPSQSSESQSRTAHLPSQIHDLTVDIIDWTFHHSLGHISRIFIKN